MQNQRIINAEIVKSESTDLERLEEVEDKLAWLSESERYALDYFRATYQKNGSRTFPLAQTLQEQLFSLYLNGKSLSEIRALNPQLMLGQIVDAAITGDWHQLRQDYLNEIQNRASVRLKQIACESVDFLADQMATAHKLQGDALKRYLQTGNPADLGGYGVGSIKQYKDVAELILKMTGQDKTSTLNIKGEISHTDRSVDGKQQSAGKTLAQLAKEKKEKDTNAT
jgi:hypothetical protein